MQSTKGEFLQSIVSTVPVQVLMEELGLAVAVCRVCSPRWACPIGRMTAWLQGDSPVPRPRKRPIPIGG